MNVPGFLRGLLLAAAVLWTACTTEGVRFRGADAVLLAPLARHRHRNVELVSRDSRSTELGGSETIWFRLVVRGDREFRVVPSTASRLRFGDGGVWFRSVRRHLRVFVRYDAIDEFAVQRQRFDLKLALYVAGGVVLAAAILFGLYVAAACEDRGWCTDGDDP